MLPIEKDDDAKRATAAHLTLDRLRLCSLTEAMSWVIFHATIHTGEDVDFYIDYTERFTDANDGA